MLLTDGNTTASTGEDLTVLLYSRGFSCLQTQRLDKQRSGEKMSHLSSLKSRERSELYLTA